ncbi:MAG: ATP synthase F1 subunit gamma [Clostridiales bacterium]|nr:ATP synthase F1 subunit gamma [Clostridiales bacterium]
MNSLADLKRRIASVKQTGRITGAMETISIAKMHKSLELYESNNAYFDMIDRFVKAVVADSSEDVQEILSPPQSGYDLVVAVSSDTGFCGAFNHDVFRLTDSMITDNTLLMTVGHTAADYYSSEKKIVADRVDTRFTHCAYTPDYKNARRMADEILLRYGSDVKSVAVVYNGMISHASWGVRKLEILPLSVDTDGVSGGMEFEPSAKEVFKLLLPQYISGIIYGVLVHSSAAEHSARRMAMSAATKNADAMISALSIEYNRARQSAVTAQITEIIGSTQAIGANNER